MALSDRQQKYLNFLQSKGSLPSGMSLGLKKLARQPEDDSEDVGPEPAAMMSQGGEVSKYLKYLKSKGKCMSEGGEVTENDLYESDYRNSSGEPHTEADSEINHPMEFMSEGGEVSFEPEEDHAQAFVHALRRRRLKKGY